MGYTTSAYVKTNLPEPNAKLHRVKAGVAGTAIGIAEHYYKAYANDWGQDLRFYVNVLAHVNKQPVPDDTAGWKAVHFNAGELIWVPSHDFARSLQGSVNSGSITYNVADALGVAELIERIGELIDDFGTAMSLSLKYIPEAVARHAKQALVEALVGMAKMLIGAMLLTALLTAGGALIGGPAGAAIGFKVSMAIIHWLGLGMLMLWLGQSLVKIGGAFGSFVTMVWNARSDHKKLDAAAHQLAEALGVLVGVLVEAAVMFVAAWGAGKAFGALKNSTLGSALGEAGLRRLLEQKPRETKAEPEAKTEPEAKREIDPRSADEARTDPEQIRRFERYKRTSKSKLEFREWWDKYGRKPTPNPHGKPGDPSHASTINDKLVEMARKEFPNDKIVRGASIQGLKTPNGKTIRIDREPDVTVIDGKDGVTVKKVYEAARTNKDGSFVTREVTKKKQYDGLGIKNHFEPVQEK